jgi:aminocarboxymuconate-semialdehyde decarboxylase
MMFTCVIPGCDRPGHYHPAMAAARKRRTKESRPRKHSSAVVRDKKGRSLRVDIHCHYLNREAQAKLAHLNPSQYEPSVKFANPLTREVNVKQMQDRAPKLSTIEVRLADMDKMGIDVQAVCPAPQQTYYWTEPGLGLEVSRMINDRLAEIVATWPDRFVGLGTVPLQNVDLAVTELERCVKQLGLRGVERDRLAKGVDRVDEAFRCERWQRLIADQGDVLVFAVSVFRRDGVRAEIRALHVDPGRPRQVARDA